MTSSEAHSKVLKLLTLAAPGSGATPDEAATAARIADQICAKYGITPTPPSHVSAAAHRALSGDVAPGWAARPQREGRGTSWWGWVGRFGSDETGYSGINDTQARAMALAILSSGAYLNATEFEVVEGALNGLLTEYGKILLDGLYALSI